MLGEWSASGAWELLGDLQRRVSFRVGLWLAARTRRSGRRLRARQAHLRVLRHVAGSLDLLTGSPDQDVSAAASVWGRKLNRRLARATKRRTAMESGVAA